MSKKLIFSAIFCVFLISCSGNSIFESAVPDDTGKTEKQKAMEAKIEKNDFRMPEGSSLLDGEGLLNLGDMLGFEPGESFNVNSLLFSVALEKIEFMPLLSVDAGSGVIVTDWYSFDEGKTRIKINIRVINEELNDDSLAINLFKQTFENSVWVDKGIDQTQAAKIKNSILSTARNLKIASEL